MPKSKITKPNEEEGSKFICCDCIREEFLSNEIETKGRRRKCSFCQKKGKTYLLSAIINRVEKVVNSFYERTSDQPNTWQERLQADRESNYFWQREGMTLNDILQNDFDIDAAASEAIPAILAQRHYDMDLAAIGEENDFDPDAKYELKQIGHGNWLKEWEEFKRILKF